MKTGKLILLLIVSAFIARGQVLTGSGMVYEDEVKYKGFAEGKIYKTDGTVMSGYINFPYTDAGIRFKKSKDEKNAEVFTPEEVTGFTLVKDSFATISNFRPETYGYMSTQYYSKGFVKVLVDGPLSLFKHYSVQSVSNYQVVTVESYLVARKEERFSRFFIISTRNAASFTESARRIFRRNAALNDAIQSGKLTFLDLRAMVTRYNESYAEVEKESETSEVFLVRINKNERPVELRVTANDSTVIVPAQEDILKLKLTARINIICLEEQCLYFRSDNSRIQHIECGFKAKAEKPFIQLVHEDYIAPYIYLIQKRKAKKMRG